MFETKNNNSFVLNIACPYTSHEELGTVSTIIQAAVTQGKLLDTDVSDQLLSKALYINTPVDIMIRTSGEIRLSDFLLHQTCRDTLVFFPSKMWPEFTFWTLLPYLVIYQFYHNFQAAMRKEYEKDFITNTRVERFLQQLEHDRLHSYNI
jgi:ditrans,polycis-polyprenyl diphosphate synthase